LDYERTTLNISDDEKVFVRVEQKTGENEVVRYQYDNHLGSASLELDDTGQIISYEEYHPFGTTSYRSGRSETEVSLKRYKYCGKERDEETGLYYYGMRYYAVWLCRFVSVDPLQFKYPELTPYACCLNNPLRYIDPDGRDVWEINDDGRIVNRIKDKTQDAFYMVAKDADGNYQRTFTTDADGNKTYNSISFDYGTVESQRSISFSPDGKTTDTYDVYKVRGDNNGTQLFEFMSNNVSGSGTGVEISQAMTGIAGDKGLNFVTTGHMKATEPGMTHLLNGQLLHGYTSEN
jgi:RHS repeat-associated protein